MRSDIAVIGDSKSILVYKTLGFKTYDVSTSDEVVSVVDRLEREKCGVIFITEQALEGAEVILKTNMDNSSVAIIPIPGRSGATGMGMQNLSNSVERAIGADILFNNER